MKIGLEREGLLFDENKKPIQLSEFDLKDGTCLDFCDHQIEFVSKICYSSDELITEMYKQIDHPIVTENYLWPLSEAGVIDYDVTINGTKTQEQKDYRQGLLDKYPLDMLLISGIHFNIDLEEGNDDLVFEQMKKVYTFLPVLLPFYSFTPRGEVLTTRNTHKYGYYNEMELNLDYSNLENYKLSIQKAVDEKKIQSAKELYAKVRFKDKGMGSYLEYRFIDINPFDRLGMSKESIELICEFSKYIAKLDLVDFDQHRNLENIEDVAMCYNPNKEYNINGEVKSLHDHMVSLLTSLGFEDLLNKYLNKETDNHKLVEMLKTETIDEVGLKHWYHKEPFQDNYPDLKMELSTKIVMKKAQDLGHEVEVLDEYNSVIAIDGELVVQATKTNRDKYANIIMLENKYMTKKILSKHGISVPAGVRITKEDEIDYTLFETKKMVVKPQDTNFGIGITILEAGSSKAQIDKAINLAFSACDLVLIEEFHKGTEYRFLVVDGKCISIVKRLPAHIVGDGCNTIEKLVKIKNTNPLRGFKYKTPVEFITLGEYEVNFLSLQNLSINDVPADGEVIYLRENSNISTGGDSVEFFDQVPEFYKEQAVLATKYLDVEICGLDLMIDDMLSYEYTIIEANFNPAIQMHTYPLVGIGKDVASDIIKCILKGKND